MIYKKVAEVAKQFRFALYLRRIYLSKNVSSPKWKTIISGSKNIWKESITKDTNKRKILIATGIGHFYAATALESLLAAALTLRDAEIHILLCDSFLPACQACTIYNTKNILDFTEHGPKKTACIACYKAGVSTFRQLNLKILRYSEFITREQLEEVSALAMSTPASEIKTYTKNNLAIGEHAMAGALRFYANGTLENEPEGELILRAYFNASLRAYYVAQNLAKEQNYDSVVLHHGIYIPQGILGEVFRRTNTRVVTWNPAYRSKTFVFSHDDTYHHTLISESVDKWKNISWSDTLDKTLMAYLESRRDGSYDWISFLRNPSQQDTQIDLSKPTIGMLTNVMWDAQLHYPANAFENMLDWTLKTIKYFINRQDLQLVIRVHPAETSGFMPSRQPIISEIRKVFQELPKNIFIISSESKVSTYDIMDKCNAVIIYGTKTGVELAARGIPVIVAGEAWVRNKGITIDVSDEEEYYKILDELPLKHRLEKQKQDEAKKYAFHFFFRRMIPLQFAEPTGKIGMPYIVKVDSLDDIMPGKDPGLDVICDGIINNNDFIFHAEEAI